jgi:hypothetical protein
MRLVFTELNDLPLVAVKYLRIRTFCSTIPMSQILGLGIVGQPSSFRYTRAGALAGSFVSTDSVKMHKSEVLQRVIWITVMSPNPVVPDFTHFGTFVSC